MNISTALNRKNKLGREITKLYQDIRSHNTVVVANDEVPTREIDVEATLNKALALEKELITLKVALDKASTPIRVDIYQLSELKSRINSINSISGKTGATTRRFENVIERNDSVITANKRREMVEQIQSEIDALTAKITDFNYTTQVEV